jgi:ketol-acid reductoisomerase
LTIKHLAYRLAHEFAGGAVALAALMGKGEKVLQNKLNPNSETHYLNIDELEMLADFTSGNRQVAQYFAQKTNAAVVQLPTDVMTGDMSLLDAFMDAAMQDGEFANEFKKAWSDGRITVQEFERLEKIQFESIGKRLALLAEIKQVVR